MANPFLVLGGIAVSVITAAFGILQVPGWVASAQDAAAVNDLSNIRAAQAASMSTAGAYFDDLADIADGRLGLTFTKSGGVELVGIATSADAWCATVRSESKTYFAASSGTSKIGKGTTPEEAAADAGCSGSIEPPVEVSPFISFTINCPTATNVGLPLEGADGTVFWDGGVGQPVSGTATPVAVGAGEPHTVRFEGTFATLSANALSAAERNCFRSVDEWEGDTGTTSMYLAFYNMTNLVSVPAEIPSGITNLAGVFRGATNFNAPIGDWDTSEVTTLSQAFYAASNFNQPLNWDTSKVQSMALMFGYASKFNQPFGPKWDTGAVTTMERMFQSAMAFDQPIDSWNTSNVTNMSKMFNLASNFNHPVGGWDTSKVTTMESMFDSATKFNQTVGTWNTREVTSMERMFAVSAYNQPLNGPDWVTSKVTTMKEMFQSTPFNHPIGGWDTSNVVDMSAMFRAASSFNQPIGGWDTANVTDMSWMFTSAYAFNQNISGWNVGAVTNHSEFGTFSGLSPANAPAGWVI